jgi:ABC-type branched-subunit amino acid transport system permease subunit
MVLGVILVVLVLAMPTGLVGTAAQLWARIRPRS